MEAQQLKTSPLTFFSVSEWTIQILYGLVCKQIHSNQGHSSEWYMYQQSVMQKMHYRKSNLEIESTQIQHVKFQFLNPVFFRDPADFARPPINYRVCEIPRLFSPSKLGGANLDTGLTRGFRIGGCAASIFCKSSVSEYYKTKKFHGPFMQSEC
jgi:hypothetical protein